MEAGGDSQNLRDFLKMKQDDNFHRSGNYSGMTLNAVLSDKSGQETETLDRNHSNRTLLDIIREESSINNTDAPGKRSWRHFREKLRLRRNASNWTSSVRIPASDIPFNNNSTQRSFTQFGTESGRLLQRNSSRTIDRASGRFEHTSSLAMRRSSNRENEIDDEAQVVVSGGGEEDDDEEESGGQQSGGRTSLMALLAETDRQMGLDGVGYMMDGEEEDEEDEEEESVTGGGGGGDYNNCCVCMVRHKGAAFIPCGHTFCRLCSRELFAQRGNCPLCNNYILEILDIF